MLRTEQGAANNQRTQAPLSWDALNNMGVPINYDAFAARWDSPDEGPLLKKLVAKFDGRGLLVKTNEKEPSEKSSVKPNEVEKMAKRATKLGK